MSVEWYNPKDFPLGDGWNQTSVFDTHSYLSGKIADGFELPSRGQSFITPEIIVVDRKSDFHLTELLTQAQEIRSEYTDDVEVAFHLAQLVHRRMESPNGYSKGNNFTD